MLARAAKVRRGARSQSHWATLGVQAQATPPQIRAAFLNLVKKWHPDLSKHPNAAEKMIKINTAYAALYRDLQHVKATGSAFSNNPAAPKQTEFDRAKFFAGQDRSNKKYEDVRASGHVTLLCKGACGQAGCSAKFVGTPQKVKANRKM
ncbi:hypothetical protein M885DRAFT_531533 [Pelagophyceae sp. CCMP2097]|nr:hypothetical protein M885DRAFT_531533 [Pelagophyceae sp. CCMP2097]